MRSLHPPPQPNRGRRSLTKSSTSRPPVSWLYMLCGCDNGASTSPKRNAEGVPTQKDEADQQQRARLWCQASGDSSTRPVFEQNSYILGPAAVDSMNPARTCSVSMPQLLPVRTQARILGGFMELHAQPSGGRSAVTDVICPMYARVDTITRWAKDPNNKRPVILCEYQHAMNNSNGGLKEYWCADPARQGAEIPSLVEVGFSVSERLLVAVTGRPWLRWILYHSIVK